MLVTLRDHLLVTIFIPLLINLFTGWWFYYKGEVAERAKEVAERAKVEASYLAFGFVDLRGGLGTAASTEAVATVYLYSSYKFEDIGLTLEGANIEGPSHNDLSQYFDPKGAGPQSVRVHLTDLDDQVVTYLTFRNHHPGNRPKQIRVIQRFRRRLLNSNGEKVVEFTPVKNEPDVEGTEN